MEFTHYSVLAEETIEYLKVRPDGIYVDGTLGGGGHAARVASRLSEKGRLIGIDQDADAVRAAGERLAPFGGRITILRGNFADMAELLQQIGISRVDGIVLDLGVSSFQLDTPERGFTYRVADAPLDMRMDVRQTKTAADIVNGYGREELYRVIRDYGEERFAKQIAANIVKARERKPVQTAGELTELIRAAIPAKYRMQGGHPAKRTFQAIRIELNRELDVLSKSLTGMIGLLKPGGRICIITFHSLEDRIVKTAFRQAEQPCTCPKEFPVCVCGKVSQGTVVTKKPVLPGEEEQKENSRSKSAKLRVFERK